MRYAHVQARIEDACRIADRKPSEVTLVAVSKGQDIQKIEAAYLEGQRDFGENYVQELQEKKSRLAHLDEIRWHMIGHLQSNKAKFISNCYSIDSIDRTSILEILERSRMRESSDASQIRVLLQLRVDENDPNKSGISFEDAPELCKYLAPLVHVSWAGFMGIGPAGKDAEELQNLYLRFAMRAKELWQTHAPIPSFDPVMSLGMSADLEIAIRSGSTEVRVGSDLFGPRQKNLTSGE